MKALDVASSISSKERPWFNIFRLQLDRQVAAGWFPCSAHVAWVDGLGDADYWAVEFHCGLKVAFEFLHDGIGGDVCATEYVPQHVARHLKHWGYELEEYPGNTFAMDRNHMIERFVPVMPELAESHKYKHKQTYWVSRVSSDNA